MELFQEAQRCLNFQHETKEIGDIFKQTKWQNSRLLRHDKPTWKQEKKIRIIQARVHGHDFLRHTGKTVTEKLQGSFTNMLNELLINISRFNFRFRSSEIIQFHSQISYCFVNNLHDIRYIFLSLAHFLPLYKWIHTILFLNEKDFSLKNLFNKDYQTLCSHIEVN